MEEVDMIFNKSFWQGKNVLITGHTGFKGCWLVIWLLRLGANVSGIALSPNTSPNLFELTHVARDMESFICDIRDEATLVKYVHKIKPDIVFHLAAQPLVLKGYEKPLETFAINIMGSANLLNSLRDLNNLQVVVMVTTDKVYFNNELSLPFREDDILGGHDPYSASKAASELVIASFRDAFLKDLGVSVASARAGNVIGGGDWSANRLIPDAIRAWSAGNSLIIRNPKSTRPWQHVLEPLLGYINLAQKLWHTPDLAGAYNFGPHTHEIVSVETIVKIAHSTYGYGSVILDDTSGNPHEAGVLALEIAKARNLLDFKPKWLIDESVKRTIDWYKALHNGSDARTLCETEIADYQVFS